MTNLKPSPTTRGSKKRAILKDAPAAATFGSTVPVIEESLQVTKEAVDRGGFRVATQIETRSELVDELLRSEGVEIERRVIGEFVPDGDVPGARQEGDTLVIPVLEEVLVTVKRTRLVEEVRITRVSTTHRKPQTYPVRKTIVTVERLDADRPSVDENEPI